MSSAKTFPVGGLRLFNLHVWVSKRDAPHRVAVHNVDDGLLLAVAGLALRNAAGLV